MTKFTIIPGTGEFRQPIPDQPWTGPNGEGGVIIAGRGEPKHWLIGIGWPHRPKPEQGGSK